MDVDLTPARLEDSPALSHLMQLYCYDLSGLLELEMGDDGLFPTPARWATYWTEPQYHPFFIRVGGRRAGFAVVDARSRLDNTACWDMSEFFVLRRHRGAGVGARAATAAFDAFRGRWEVREVVRNTPAQSFWRNVIGRYTAGRFREVMWDDARWRGPVQTFDSSLGGAPSTAEPASSESPQGG
jgi:predicted acetyltransferase